MSTPAAGFDSVLLRTIAAADQQAQPDRPVASTLGGGTRGMRLRYSRPVVVSLDTAETACYSTGIRNIEACFETDFDPAFAISWALPTQFVSLQFSVLNFPPGHDLTALLHCVVGQGSPSSSLKRRTAGDVQQRPS